MSYWWDHLKNQVLVLIGRYKDRQVGSSLQWLISGLEPEMLLTRLKWILECHSWTLKMQRDSTCSWPELKLLLANSAERSTNTQRLQAVFKHLRTSLKQSLHSQLFLLSVFASSASWNSEQNPPQRPPGKNRRVCFVFLFKTKHDQCPTSHCMPIEPARWMTHNATAKRCSSCSLGTALKTSLENNKRI